MVAAVAAVVMEEDVADMVVAEAVVSHICTLSPPFHLLMELTRTLVGGFTSSNSAPLGGSRRW
jgi:hypothetical protein